MVVTDFQHRGVKLRRLGCVSGMCDGHALRGVGAVFVDGIITFTPGRAHSVSSPVVDGRMMQCHVWYDCTPDEKITPVASREACSL